MKKGKEKERIRISVGRRRGKNNHGCIVNGVGVVSITPSRMQKHLFYRHFLVLWLILLTALESVRYEALGGRGRKACKKWCITGVIEGSMVVIEGSMIGVI